MRWFKNSADGAEIVVDDVIGFWGVSGKEFRQQVNALKGSPITVRINSMGGDPVAAVNMFTVLREHGNVTTQVDGWAASAASIIMLAGNTRKIAENGWVVIHNPSTVAAGDEQELLKALNGLRAVRDNIITTYEKRTDNSREQVIQWMDEETWFTGSQAKEHNFATEVSPMLSFTASLDPSKFRNVPKAVLDSYRGRSPQPSNDSEFMSSIKEFFASLKATPAPPPPPPGPSEREKFAIASIEALGVKFDELVENKDEKGLLVAVEAYAAKGNKELTDKLADGVRAWTDGMARISDALKAAGFDFGPDKIDGLKDAVEARIKTAASKQAVTITASRGIAPVPSSHAAAGDGHKKLTATEKAIEARKAAGLPVPAGN